MQLVVRVGESGDGHTLVTSGGMDKFVVSRINSDVRNSPLVGVLKEYEIPWPQLSEVHRFAGVI